MDITMNALETLKSRRYVIGGMAIAVVLAATAALSASAGGARSAPSACPASMVHYTHYPGNGLGLGQLPWVEASPVSQGLVGLLVYWREDWRAANVTAAQMYAGGQAPNGLNMKVLWAFLAPKAKRVVRVEHRLGAERRAVGVWDIGVLTARDEPIDGDGTYGAGVAADGGR